MVNAFGEMLSLAREVTELLPSVSNGVASQRKEYNTKGQIVFF